MPSTTLKRSGNHPHPMSGMRSLGCWSRTAIPIKPSPRCGTSLAGAGGLYDRGVPVRLAFDQIQRGTVAQMMTPDGLC